MTTFDKQKIFSWLSQASYLTFEGVPEGTTGTALAGQLTASALGIDKRFAATQATAVAESSTGYAIVNSLPNTTNGASVTVFKSNDPTDGSYTIAVRGTEPGAQVATDLLQDLFGVVLAGKAKVQLIEAFRYYKRLTTPSGGAVTYADQERISIGKLIFSGTPLFGLPETIAAAVSYFNAMTANDVGLGDPGQTLIPSGAKINFTGHSLGGHVAYLLAQLVDATAVGGRTVGDVTTYNAPGENALLYEVQNWLGINTSSQAGNIGSKHLAIYGDGGLKVTSGLGQVIGTRKPIFIETDGPIIVGNLSLENHSIVKLSDSLAVYELFSRLDPSLSDSKIKSILEASANGMADSLEAALDSVRRVFLGAGVVPTKAPGSEDNRNAFYQHLGVLLADGQFTSIANTDSGQNASAGRVLSLVGMSADQLEVGAQSDFGVFLALHTLSPFALIEADDIYEVTQTDLFDKWREDFKDSVTGTLRHFSDAYLRDRSGLLQAVLASNALDNPGLAHVPRINAEYHYFSGGNEYTLFTSPPDQPTQFVEFADDAGRPLLGTPNVRGDRLYGGAGNDSLNGGSGNDYLEGGVGNDTYTYNTGDGFDIIYDRDGLGQIVLDGAVFTGATKTIGNSYVGEDGATDLSFIGDLISGGTLTISNEIRVEKFKNGDLGITLNPTPSQDAPAFTFTYIGRDHPVGDTTGSYQGGSDFNDHFLSADIHWSDEQEVVILGGAGGLFLGEPGDDLEQGSYFYQDFLFGGAGDDTIEGAALGSDLAGPNIVDVGGDQLIGGAGQDLIIGSRYSDRIAGDMDSHVTAQNLLAPTLVDTFFHVANFTAGPSGDPSHPGLQGVWEDYSNIDWSDSRIHYFGNVADALNYALGISAETDLEALYDDYLEGGAGDDTILGENGSDAIYGGAGDDVMNGDGSQLLYIPLPTASFGQETFGSYKELLGRPGDDYIDGGEGNDTLRDTVVYHYGAHARGAGNDVLLGGNGDDNLLNIDNPPPGYFPDETSFSNILDGGDGNDTLTSYNITVDGYDQLLGGAGNDVIWLAVADAFVGGGEGNDAIFVDGGSGQHDVDGGDGDDTIALSSTFSIDFGSVSVKGGAGNDTVSVAWITQLEIDQSGTDPSDFDMLSFRSDTLAPSGQTLPQDVLLRRIGDDLALEVLPRSPYSSNIPPSEIVVTGWFQDDSHKLDAIEFGDETIWTPFDVAFRLAQGNVGTQGPDILVGSFDDVVLQGLGDSDRLIQRSGRDLLDGGGGDDLVSITDAPTFVIGGPGSDLIDAAGTGSVVAFNRGDGQDSLVLVGGTLSFGGGIEIGNLALTLSAEFSLIVDVGEGDSITLARWFDTDPFSPSPLAVQIVEADHVDLFDLGAALVDFLSNAFQDPTILSWPPTTDWSAYLLGTSANSAIGGELAYQYATTGSTSVLSQDSIILVLNDSAFGSGLQPLNLDFNQAPALANPIVDRSALEDSAFSFTVPADTFSDPDLADSFTFATTLVNGDSLPGWLSFEPNTRTFSGMPSNADVGTLSVKVTATDAAGLSVSDTFEVTVANTNDPPVATNDGIAVNEDATTAELVATLLANDTDADAGDTKRIVSVNGTGTAGTVAFSAQAQTLTYTANAASQAALALGATATDGFAYTMADTEGTTSSAIVNVTITGLNDAPTLAHVLADRSAAQGSAFSYAVPADSFGDIDAGETLSLAASRLDGSPLPGWLAFNPANHTFSGTPSASDVGILSVRVNATDPHGASVSDAFDVAVSASVHSIEGTPAGDVLIGTSGDDLINGYEGNDQIDAGQGNDTLVGGSGSDSMVGGAGDDIFMIAGTDASYDYVNGGSGFDVVQGGSGDDTFRFYDFSGANTVECIDGGAGYNVVAAPPNSGSALNLSGVELVNIARIVGSTVADYLTGSAGADVIEGGAGSDVLSGGAGDDVFLIVGTDAGYDYVSGGSGFDVVQGGAGDDTFRFYDFSGANTVERIDGGAGYNIVAAPPNSGSAINLSGTELVNIARIVGSTVADYLTGSAGADVIEGGAGSDVLSGGAGDDVFLIVGTDAGYDYVSGGSGFDVVQGGAGDDIFRFYDFSGANTVERIDGGAGYNIVAAPPNSGSALNLSGVELVNIARIVGSTVADYLTGSAGADVIEGGAGSDVLSGGAGDDVFLIVGTDAGYDYVSGGSGFDVVQGGAGDDTFRFYDFSGANTVERIEGGAGYNVVAAPPNSGSEIDLSGTELVNVARIVGSASDDYLTGSAGADVIEGGAGSDAIAGGTGNDMLTGGLGGDVLKGGDGADSYVFNRGDGLDTIDATGTSGADRIVFGSGISMDDLVITRAGSDLSIVIRDPENGSANDRITVSSWWSTPEHLIERFEFGDGSTLTGEEAHQLALVVVGTSGNDALSGSGENNLLEGFNGDDSLNGAQGTDVLQGGAGNDSVVDNSGNGLLDGGAGEDAVTGGAGNDLAAGGTGNDTIETGAGSNVVAFNAGDGVDTVRSAAGAANSLSLGGGLHYDDLSPSKNGNDLVLNAGANDKVVLKDWYEGVDTVANLQVIVDATAQFDANSQDPLYNRRVQTFDFLGLVNQFDQARVETPGLTSWALTNALLQFHLSGSDEAALGGDLAYFYGKNGAFSGITFDAAQQLIGAPGFGQEAQSLHAFGGLQEGLARLS